VLDRHFPRRYASLPVQLSSVLHVGIMYVASGFYFRFQQQPTNQAFYSCHQPWMMSSIETMKLENECVAVRGKMLGYQLHFDYYSYYSYTIHAEILLFINYSP
jgi:hypothetical protein